MVMTTTRRASWAAIALAMVAGFEGLRQGAYLDPVGIPTICFGETKGVHLSQHATEAQCEAMLADSLAIANRAVDLCIHAPLGEYRRAALVSFAYNVGQANLCSSTLARKLNAGDAVGACNELPRWNRAKGIVLPGLTRRRATEQAMCLGALP